MGNCCTRGSESITVETKEKNPSSMQEILMTESLIESLKVKKVKANLSTKETIDTDNSSTKSRLCDSENELDDDLMVEENLIREDEFSYVRFSKKGIYEFFKMMSNSNINNWKTIFDKGGLTLQTNNKFEYNSEFMVIKAKYILKKIDIPKTVTLSKLAEYIYEPKFRNKWDKSIKFYELTERNKSYSKAVGCFHSPAFFVSERDFYDKRVDFFTKDAHYCFASTVKGEENNNQDSRVRINNFINAMVINEYEDCYTFIGYNQFDPKFKLPDFILNMTIPDGSLNWYINLVQMINQTDNS